MYKRRHLTAQQNAQNVVFNPSVALTNSILRTPSMVDEFYVESIKPLHDKMESKSFCDPIIMLFNQERLDNMGDTCTKQFLDSLAQKESSLAELRKKCDDDTLLQMIRSRYLQTPSEVTAWCRYIETNVDSFNAEMQAAIAAQQSQVAQTTDNATLNTE